MIDGREKINDISSRCWYFSRLSSELSPFTAAPRPISDGWKKRAGLLDDKLRQKKSATSTKAFKRRGGWCARQDANCCFERTQRID
jgi:hypothetical protein